MHINTIDVDKLSDDRLSLDFHEGDENGYIYTPSGGAEGEDHKDKALWVGAVIYVEYPEHTLERMREDDDSPWFGWTLTEAEKQSFIPWITKQYPKVDDFVDSGDDRFLYADFIGRYKEGETTEQLLYRLCVTNSPYVEIRNDWEILFNGFNDFMDFVKDARERKAEEWLALVVDDGSDYAHDASTGLTDLMQCPYVVQIQDDADRLWIVGCKSDKEIARAFMGQFVEDENEWVEGVYHFDTAEVYKAERTVTVTISVNNDEYTFNGGI